MKEAIADRIARHFEHEVPLDFVTSQWQRGEKSAAYLYWRLFVATFYVFSVFTSIGYAIYYGYAEIYFIYLTHWNLCMTMAATMFGAVLVTLHYEGKMRVTERMTRVLRCYWFLSTNTNMYSVFVTILYWTILYKKDVSVIDFNNVLVHITNSVVLIVDLMIVRLPVKLSHAIYPIACGSVFMFFTWLYPALGGVNK